MAKSFGVEFDTSELDAGLNALEADVEVWWKIALGEMADTLLLLSRKEVPHDTGHLQKSGNVFWKNEDKSSNVSYNTPYAAYLHEGMRRDGTYIVRNFQKKRKKKYLEDPMKMNISSWEKIALNEMKKHF